MEKLLGTIIMSKQEVCHQINNYGFVHCSHTFINIGLAPKADRVILNAATTTADAPIPVTGTTVTPKRVSVNIVELYFKREKAVSWDTKLPLIEWVIPFLIKEGLPLKDICLIDFCKRFTVGAGVNNKNLIARRTNTKVVPVFYPRGHKYSNKNHTMYYIYCMYFVIRFHNWGGNLEYYDEFDFSETAGISDEKNCTT
jgi:hypothetical protein